jgi:hypothetical protein
MPRGVRGWVELPLEPQPIAEAQRLDGEVTAGQVEFAAQRDGATPAAVVGQRHPEQVGQVLEHAFRARWVGAHQRHRGVQCVEQEMRADPRLQFGQARTRIRRQAPAFAPVEPGRHQTRHRGSDQRQPDQARGAGVQQLQPEHRQAGGQREHGAEQHQRERAPCGRHRLQRAAQCANQRQPDQCGGQRDRQSRAQCRQGDRTAVGTGQHRQQHRAVDRQQGAQSESAAADIEDRTGADLDRSRAGIDWSRLRRAL